MKEILLGIDGMSLEDLVAIAREESTVRLTKESEDRIATGMTPLDPRLMLLESLPGLISISTSMTLTSILI